MTILVILNGKNLLLTQFSRGPRQLVGHYCSFLLPRQVEGTFNRRPLPSRIVTLWNEVDRSLNFFAPGGGPAVALPHAVAEEPADLVAALPEDGGALAGHDAPPARPVPLPAAVALLPLEAREEVASRPRKVAVRIGGLGRLVVKVR